MRRLAASLVGLIMLPGLAACSVTGTVLVAGDTVRVDLEIVHDEPFAIPGIEDAGTGTTLCTDVPPGGVELRRIPAPDGMVGCRLTGDLALDRVPYLTHSGGYYWLNLPGDGARLGSVAVSMTFPGGVIASDGAARPRGTVVTWEDVQVGVLGAQAVAHDGTGLPRSWLFGVGGFAVGATAASAGWWMHRRRTLRAAADAPGQSVGAPPKQ